MFAHNIFIIMNKIIHINSIKIYIINWYIIYNYIANVIASKWTKITLLVAV